MEKKDVIKQARDYMLTITAAPDREKMLQGKINNMRAELNLLPAAGVAHYGPASGRGTSISSVVERQAARVRALEDEIQETETAINEMMAEWQRVTLFIQTSICERIDIRAGIVARCRYVDRLTIEQTLKYLHITRPLFRKLEGFALMSIASILLGLRADGEYYNKEGYWIRLTPKQRERIERENATA